MMMISTAAQDSGSYIERASQAKLLTSATLTKHGTHPHTYDGHERNKKDTHIPALFLSAQPRRRTPLALPNEEKLPLGNSRFRWLPCAGAGAGDMAPSPSSGSPAKGAQGKGWLANFSILPATLTAPLKHTRTRSCHNLSITYLFYPAHTQRYLLAVSQEAMSWGGTRGGWGCASFTAHQTRRFINPAEADDHHDDFFFHPTSVFSAASCPLPAPCPRQL